MVLYTHDHYLVTGDRPRSTDSELNARHDPIAASDRSWPFSASHYALLSVSYGENRRSELILQSRLSADTVEKLQIFPDGKFIYTLTISKF